MGNVRSLLMKPFKTYNIDRRAEKVISRDKPFSAPMHKASKKQLDVARSVAPTFIQEQYKKDPQLDERLKNVYLKSEDHPILKAEDNPDRPLPENTKIPEDFEYGFWEPENPTEGRCNLRSVLTFITDYSNDSVKNSPANIAAKYKLDIKDVSNILEYIRVFQIVKPKDGQSLPYTERMAIPSPLKKED